MPPETTISLFPCKDLDATLDFYRALGFEVTHAQSSPYLYAAVRRGEIQLHFGSLAVYGAKNAFGAQLVFVSDVAAYHRAFADGLRTAYGRIPTADYPRLTRWREGDTRFKLFDPSGNLMIYIDRTEPEADYNSYSDPGSALLQALDTAVFLRDTYANDTAAAKVLDKALAENPTGSELDRARVLAARAELAVARGESERLEALQSERLQRVLSAAELQTHREELEAPERLLRWLSAAPPAETP